MSRDLVGDDAVRNRAEHHEGAIPGQLDDEPVEVTLGQGQLDRVVGGGGLLGQDRVERRAPSALRVVQHEFWSHGAQNNWAVPQARHPWVMVVDADERVTPSSPGRSGRFCAAPPVTATRSGEGTFSSGGRSVTAHGERLRSCALPSRQRALPGAARPLTGQLDGRPGRCRETMIHNTYRSLDDYARKIHRFSREARSMKTSAVSAAAPGRSSPTA